MSTQFRNHHLERRRASPHDASDEERWGSSSAWDLDEVLAQDADEEIDPLPIPAAPTSPPQDGRRRTP